MTNSIGLKYVTMLTELTPKVMCRYSKQTGPRPLGCLERQAYLHLAA